MKIKPNALSQMYRWLRKSPVDDMAIKAAKSAGSVSGMPSTGATLQKVLNATDAVDDMPTSISFDDIADAYKNRIPADKSPITSSEFVRNYKAQIPSKSETRQLLDSFPELYANAPSELDFLNAPAPEYFESLKLDGTPDYDAMDIRPEHYGQDPNLIDSLEFPDGFTDPEHFAHYYEDLERGYRTPDVYRTLDGRHLISYTTPNVLPPQTVTIDGRTFNYPKNVSDYQFDYYDSLNNSPSYSDFTKASILDAYVNSGLGRQTSSYNPPHTRDVVRGIDTRDNLVWRPHENDGLGKFFKKYGRLPKGITTEGFTPDIYPNLGFNPYDLPF